jgi:uncharacterized ion transporter superfamily protein YfcC
VLNNASEYCTSMYVCVFTYRLGGVIGIVFAIGPKVRGFKSGRCGPM